MERLCVVLPSVFTMAVSTICKQQMQDKADAPADNADL
jgi:hypothetical protein